MPGSKAEVLGPEKSPSTPVVGSDGRQKAKDLAPSLKDKAKNRKIDKQHDAATGVSAAGARAAAAPIVRSVLSPLAFYFRSPAKAFISPRLDYLGFARAINPRIQANEAWSRHITTPWIVAHAVREHGWQFIPKQILGPLVANVGIGAILYTTYLQTLASLQGTPTYQRTTRVNPPPPVAHTFTAGFTAGAIQSFVAAPLDALQIRFDKNLLLSGHYKDMWHYAYHKLREIGVRGVAAGLGLSVVKDSLGFATFFATFEYVKAQSFYAFVTRYYGNLGNRIGNMKQGPEGEAGVPTIKPNILVEPAFLLLAGVSATVTHQLIQHPLGLFQVAHYERLETLDIQAKTRPSAKQTFQIYRAAYAVTLQESSAMAKESGGWRRSLYRGFFKTTLRQVPSTAAGLVIFEVMRRAYADGSEEVRIEKNGYDILLT